MRSRWTEEGELERATRHHFHHVGRFVLLVADVCAVDADEQISFLQGVMFKLVAISRTSLNNAIQTLVEITIQTGMKTLFQAARSNIFSRNVSDKNKIFVQGGCENVMSNPKGAG